MQFLLEWGSFVGHGCVLKVIRFRKTTPSVGVGYISYLGYSMSLTPDCFDELLEDFLFLDLRLLTRLPHERGEFSVEVEKDSHFWILLYWSD